MAANGVTDVEANTLLDLSIPTSSTVDLVSTMGTATAAPTKVTGGSYAAQTPTWAAATAREKHNSATVTYAGLPTITIVGTDTARPSAGARSWFIPFSSSKSVNSGDSLVFASSGMSYNLANGT